MTTDPKTYARALLNRRGVCKDMSPTAAQAAISSWDPNASQPALATRKATTATKADNRSDARKHVDEVNAARKQAIADGARHRTKERRERELNLAKSGAFRSSLGAAGRAQSAAEAAADAAADQAEAIAMGKTATTATATAPKTGKALLLQYETMAPGQDRVNFWNKNKRAILAAI